MGQYRGIVTLLEEKIEHIIIKLLCIIHPENLCAKIQIKLSMT